MRKRKTINLTKIDGCYSKELREHCPTIKFMLKEQRISCEEMKTMVHTIVAQASINAKAKERFINNLFACETKEDIDRLCHEAVIHGMYYHPKKQSA